MHCRLLPTPRLRQAGRQEGCYENPRPPKRTPLSRELRKTSTLAEVLLWNELKGKKLHGYRFLRQRPIEAYIADFYCPTLKLAIEIDGVTHDAKVDADTKRQKELESFGISFLRCTKRDVRHNLDGVLRVIEERMTPSALADSGASLIREETPLPTEDGGTPLARGDTPPGSSE